MQKADVGASSRETRSVFTYKEVIFTEATSKGVKREITEEKHDQERPEHYFGVRSIFLEQEVQVKARPKSCSLSYLGFLI